MATQEVSNKRETTTYTAGEADCTFNSKVNVPRLIVLDLHILFSLAEGELNRLFIKWFCAGAVSSESENIWRHFLDCNDHEYKEGTVIILILTDALSLIYVSISLEDR